MQELAKQLMCVKMRSGIEIWVEQERAANLQSELAKITISKFVRFEEQTFNTADIEGVYAATTIADHTRRKNGGWMCQYAAWHDRGEKCACLPTIERKAIEQREAVIKACGKCLSGYLLIDNEAVVCSCISKLLTSSG